MIVRQAVPGALSVGVLSTDTTQAACTEGNGVVTKCGHLETLVWAIAKLLEVDEEDVENALLNRTAHEFYVSAGLSHNSSTDDVDKAVRRVQTAIVGGLFDGE